MIRISLRKDPFKEIDRDENKYIIIIIMTIRLHAHFLLIKIIPDKTVRKHAERHIIACVD